MPKLRFSIFLTESDLKLFGRFVSIGSGGEGLVMNTLNSIGASVCKTAEEHGSESVLYYPKQIPPEKGSAFVGQVNFSSSSEETTAAIKTGVDTFISDLIFFGSQTDCI